MLYARRAALAATTLFLLCHCGGTGDAGLDTAAQGQSTAARREYFIAADEVLWDYAPSGRNRITGQPFGPDENVFVANGPDRIGHVYWKSLYREYTDATFTTLKTREPAWEHLGILGPVIRGAVDDTIVVHFKNNTSLPASIHPHGVRYAKNAEGAPYDDGTSGADKADDAVPPGGTFDYVWEVPERAGPAAMEGSSVMWMYHSHSNEVLDTYAGLVGPLLVTARGKARADGSPDDVDRELVVMFEVIDENQSPYLKRNIDKLTRDPKSVRPDDEEFAESNLMHSINGYVFGNQPGLTMSAWQKVRWYLMGMGTEVDLHTPHWHGNTVVMNGMRLDVATLLPASMMTADMVPDAVGTWLFHCHVNDHILAGMASLYTVAGAARDTAAPAADAHAGH